MTEVNSIELEKKWASEYQFICLGVENRSRHDGYCCLF